MPGTDDLVGDLFQRVRELSAPSVPTIRPIRRELNRQVARAEPEAIMSLALAILERSRREGEPDLRWVGYEIVHYHRPTLASLDLDMLEELGSGLDSWDSVDVFSLYLSGVAWRECQIEDDDIHRWAESENRWWRRVALVSTVALNLKVRGGTGDATRTLTVCQMLANDRDDMVVKALSWALRAVVEHDREAVESFLVEHDHCLAGRVKREVGTKLRTGRKNPRRTSVA